MSNIISIVLILVSVGTFFGYVDPTYTAIKDLRTESADYSRALGNSKKLQQERDKFLEKFNSVSADDKQKLLKLLPDNIDNVRLIIDIDEMAQTYRIPIGNFRATASDESVKMLGAKQAPYGTLTLSFSVSANYQTFLAFMADLERSLRILDITSIQFAAGDAASAYDYGVTIKTYWLK
jgi:Tfp pilus assembly protein PilO